MRAFGFWWGVVGVVVVIGVTVLGSRHHWSGNAIVVAGIVIATYLAVPLTWESLRNQSKLSSWRSREAAERSVSSDAAVGSQVVSPALVMPQPVMQASGDAAPATAPFGISDNSARPSWDATLNPIIFMLGRALPRIEDIRDVGAEATLDMQYVREHGNAINYWHAVMARAQAEHKVNLVLDLALQRTPEEELHTAVKQWRQASG